MNSSTSLPKEFEQRMQMLLGNEYSLFTKSLDTSPPVSIRINPNKNCTITGEKIEWCKYGNYLNERPVFTLDPSFHAGAYYVQEASSMLLEQAISQTIDLTKPLRILDLCAAPGGKSTHILSLINDQSLLVSNEVIRSRATILSENIQKWGKTNVVVTNNDPQDFQHLEGFFDVIVVDAPCSGEGLFRKDPQAINEWSVENTTLCSLRQRRILQDVYPSLKENGILIYSTCTYNEEENENNLTSLAREKNVEFLQIKLEETWGVEETKKGSVVGYRCYPHQVKGEGFFISIIQKKEQTRSVSFKSRKKFTYPSQKTSHLFTNWITLSNRVKLIQQNNLIIFIPADYEEDILILSERLSILNKGTAMAELKHDKPIPEHAFALSSIINKENFINLNVNKEQALRYLKKETFSINENKKGFALIIYEDNVLGWVNLLGNRFNNLYPVNWRIRMTL